MFFLFCDSLFLVFVCLFVVSIYGVQFVFVSVFVCDVIYVYLDAYLLTCFLLIGGHDLNINAMYL